jgi:hypothetical protein
VYRFDNEGKEFIECGVSPGKDNLIIRDDFGASRSNGGWFTFCRENNNFTRIGWCLNKVKIKRLDE